MRFFRLSLLVAVVAALVALAPNLIQAQEDCESVKDNSLNYAGCLERQVQQLANDLQLSVAATAPLESEITRLEKQIVSIQAQIRSAETRRQKLADSIEQREEDLVIQYALLARKTQEYYKRIRSNSSLAILLSSLSAGEISRELGYRETAANQNRNLILSLSSEISQLATDKKEAEDSKVRLASLQTSLDKQSAFLEGEVKKAKAYQSDLSGKISSLQASILAAKSGSFITSVGDSELADDYKASIKGFRESAPSGSFAVFSFGAYTHRKGMSQYGARGRAQNGQDYKKILSAYYGKEPVNKDTGGTISVSGYGSMDFETTYLYGIAEMPSGWSLEALKAQAVAARTYAYRTKIIGGTICTTEACQVFRKSKSDNPPDSWKQAVDQTRGQVLEDVVTYYSSTTGSYLNGIGWDTTDGGGGGNFFDKSFEKLGGSPWAYKAWYRKGYTASGATCGKDDPWLSNEELTDLVNAALVLKKGGDDRVTPISTSCWGGNPYSYAELRERGGVSSISSVMVTQGNGTTNEVIINGSIHLTGREFKKGFNVRAPGYLRIPQGLGFGASADFEFFNIEKK